MKPWRNPMVVAPLWGAVGVLLVVSSPSSAAIIAALAWPFVEYVAHRVALHGAEFFGARVYQRVHGVHHAHPEDVSHFLIPPAAVLITASLLLVVFPRSFVGGLLASLAAYDLVHLGCHGLGPLGTVVPHVLVAHHAEHHRHPRGNFAVTLPVVDQIFRTAIR